jgi:hypothetical protein
MSGFSVHVSKDHLTNFNWSLLDKNIPGNAKGEDTRKEEERRTLLTD